MLGFLCVLFLAAFSASAKRFHLSRSFFGPFLSFFYLSCTRPSPGPSISPNFTLSLLTFSIYCPPSVIVIRRITGDQREKSRTSTTDLSPRFLSPFSLSLGRDCFLGVVFSSLTSFCLQFLRLSLLLWHVVALVSRSARGSRIMDELRAALLPLQLKEARMRCCVSTFKLLEMYISLGEILLQQLLHQGTKTIIPNICKSHQRASRCAFPC